MKDGMNEIEAAMELLKIIAGESRSESCDVPSEKYYLELYAKCYKTVVVAKHHPSGVV